MDAMSADVDEHSGGGGLAWRNELVFTEITVGIFRHLSKD